MLKTPIPRPDWAVPCDPRLPEAALQYRKRHSLTTPEFLGSINITAWLYCDRNGAVDVKVNPNITIEELKRKFGPAQTPDAEVGFHSEFEAADWFSKKRQLQVLQIFSERVPCKGRCAPFLRHRYPGIPWYYYYDSSSWKNEQGSTIRRVAEILKSVYGL
jgi:hypothetical protein